MCELESYTLSQPNFQQIDPVFYNYTLALIAAYYLQPVGNSPVRIPPEP